MENGQKSSRYFFYWHRKPLYNGTISHLLKLKAAKYVQI